MKKYKFIWNWLSPPQFMQITGICCVYFKSKPKHESIYFYLVFFNWKYRNRRKKKLEEEIVLCKDLFLFFREKIFFNEGCSTTKKKKLKSYFNVTLNQKIPHLKSYRFIFTSNPRSSSLKIMKKKILKISMYLRLYSFCLRMCSKL